MQWRVAASLLGLVACLVEPDAEAARLALRAEADPPAAGAPACLGYPEGAGQILLSLADVSANHDGWLRLFDRHQWRLRRQEANRWDVLSLDQAATRMGEIRVAAPLAEGARVEIEIVNATRACPRHLQGARVVRMGDEALGRELDALGDAQTSLDQAKADLVGHPRRAGEAAEKGLALLTSHRAPDHSAVLAAEVLRARLLQSGGKLAEARSMIDHALPLLIDRLGWRDLDTLLAAQVKGVLLNAEGRYPEAVQWQRESLWHHTETLGEDDPETLRAENNLIESIAETGDLRTAVPMAEKSYEHRRRVLGEAHLFTIWGGISLANWYRHAGKFDRALPVASEATALAQKHLGPDHLATARAKRVEAAVLLPLGQIDRGLPLAQEAHQQLRRRGVTGGIVYQRSLELLGEYYRRLGRFDEARAILRELVAHQTRVLGADNELTVTTAVQLGLTEMDAGSPATALTQFERALRSRRAKLPPDHPITAYSRLLTGVALRQLGRLDVAQPELEAAHRILADYYGGYHPRALTANLERARILRLRGEHAAAEERLRAIFETYRESGLGESAEATTVAAELAGVLTARKRRREAQALQETIVERAERIWSEGAFTADDRRAMVAAWLAVYRDLAGQRVAQGEFAEAFSLIERAKSRGLLEALTYRHADASSSLDAQERQQLELVDARAAGLDAAMAEPNLGLSERLALRHQRDEVQREAAALRRTLRARHPKYAELAEPRLSAPALASTLLDAGEIYLNYLAADDGRLWVAALDHKGLLGVFALAKLPRPGATVAAYQELLSAPLRPGVRPAVWLLRDGSLVAEHLRPKDALRQIEDWREASRMLSARLLMPLAKRLRAYARVIVSPDGALAALPFETLLLHQGPLLNTHAVSYSESWSVLALLRQRPRPSAAQAALLAVAGPEPWPRRDDGAVWPPLPGARQEARRAVDRFVPRARLHEGRNAKESLLLALSRQGELQRYRYLLISSHGRYDPATPGRSAVVLAPDDAGSGEDGYLTATELLSYRLESEAVLLPACDSGRGHFSRGEAVTSLPYALHLAGSRHAVVALWPVSDSASPELLEPLFAGLQAGRPLAATLTESKRNLAFAGRLRHPAHWAGLVSYGD